MPSGYMVGSRVVDIASVRGVLRRVYCRTFVYAEMLGRPRIEAKKWVQILMTTNLSVSLSAFKFADNCCNIDPCFACAGSKSSLLGQGLALSAETCKLNNSTHGAPAQLRSSSLTPTSGGRLLSIPP